MTPPVKVRLTRPQWRELRRAVKAAGGSAPRVTRTATALRALGLLDAAGQVTELGWRVLVVCGRWREPSPVKTVWVYMVRP